MTDAAPLKDARVDPPSPFDDKWGGEPASPRSDPGTKKAFVIPPPPPSGGLFKEVNELRKGNRQPPEDDSLKYTDGFWGRLAANKKFEGLTFFFIGVNSLYIGVDAEYSSRNEKPADLWDADTPVGFKIMENIFCIYFTGEVVIRFIGYKIKRNCVFDGWFVFDGILVTFMVLETWLLPMFGVAGQLAQFAVLRLLRLLRISRMARLMKKVPELMIIIKGLIASFRSVGCTAILQVLILYVWSILFVSEYHEEGPDDDSGSSTFFGTMGKSMFSLFIMGTVLDDVTACTDAIRGTENFFMLSLFIVFILISSFTILNMLIGILCEVVSATAESEKTTAAESSVRDTITSLFDKLDMDGSGNITEEEFMHMRQNEDVCSALEEMDIYDSHFQRYCEILFHQTAEQDPSKPPSINFDTLITMILRLSPGNHINALDFSLLQACIDRTQENVRDRVLQAHQKITAALKENGASITQEPLKLPGSLASAAQGDSPPPPNSLGTAPAATSGKEYTLDMFARTSSHNIIEELERRLGVSDIEADTPLSQLPKQQEAFHSLGVPDE